MNSDDGNSSRPTPRRWQFSLRSMFWLTTVAGFYAWVFITLVPMYIVWVVGIYAMLTVVTVLMFWTKGKVIIGVVVGFISVNFPLVLTGHLYRHYGVVEMLFFGLHGAAIFGGIDAIIRKHWAAGWTAIILTSVFIAIYCLMFAMLTR